MRRAGDSECESVSEWDEELVSRSRSALASASAPCDVPGASSRSSSQTRSVCADSSNGPRFRTRSKRARSCGVMPSYSAAKREKAKSEARREARKVFIRRSRFASAGRLAAAGSGCGCCVDAARLGYSSWLLSWLEGEEAGKGGSLGWADSCVCAPELTVWLESLSAVTVSLPLLRSVAARAAEANDVLALGCVGSAVMVLTKLSQLPPSSDSEAEVSTPGGAGLSGGVACAGVLASLGVAAGTVSRGACSGAGGPWRLSPGLMERSPMRRR